MPADLGTRIAKGLFGAAIGLVLARALSVLLRDANADDLMLPVGFLLIVGALAYWAWRRDPL
jgi:hypothetical protein